MELLNKIADAFDPQNNDSIVSNVMQKVSDTMRDLSKSPKMNYQKTQQVSQNKVQISPLNKPLT